MQVSDFDFHGAPAGPADPASPRGRARTRRLRRAPRRIPHPDPETEMAGTARQEHPRADDVREPGPPRPR